MTSAHMLVFRDKMCYCCTIQNQTLLTSEEIHEHVSEGLEVVPPGLLLAEVRVDAHVAGGPRQALVLPVGNVLVRVCGKVDRE